jgi:hypothetical protein
MLVTLAGIVMDVIPELENARRPISVTPGGISTAPSQFASSVTTVPVIVNTSVTSPPH